MTSRDIPYPVLAVDVDGTLVDGRQEILPANAEALARYRAAGGRVVLATGRIERSVAPFGAALGLDGPAILYNGGRITDLVSGAVRAEWTLPLSLGDVAAFASRLSSPAVAIGYGAGRAVRLSVPSPEAEAVLAAYEEKDGISVERPDEGSSLDGVRLVKALFIVPTARAEALAASLTETFDGIDAVRSEATYVEILRRGVNKGSALAWLLHEWGVPPERAVAIGDNLNDAEMLAVAGIGIAVGDGNLGLRAAADVVVGPRDSGAVASAVAIALGESAGVDVRPGA